MTAPLHSSASYSRITSGAGCSTSHARNPTALAHTERRARIRLHASSPTTGQENFDVFRVPKKLTRVRKDDEEVEVPQTGWLWQTGKKGQARADPSAMATVANLKANRIKAKKSLGQNFLTDDKILLDIAKAAAVRPGDLVLEVGPGTGNLTKHLLAQGAHVTSIEKDDILFARLSEEYAEEELLRIVHGDVLRWDIPQLLEEMQERTLWANGGQQQEQEQQQQQGNEVVELSPHPLQQQQLQGAELQGQQEHEVDAQGDAASLLPRRTKRLRPHGIGLKKYRSASVPRVKVVANLPYNITKEFLKKMLPMGDYVSELSIMIQEEAAVRLVDSKPGSNDFRAMNLYVLLYSNPVYRFRISRFKYDPVPGVDGALVTFKLLPPSKRLQLPAGAGGERKFMQLVYRGFDQRRKMLRNSLQPLYTPPQVEAGLQKVGLSTRARAQELSLEQHVALAHALEGSKEDKGWNEMVDDHRCNFLSCEEMSVDDEEDF